MTGFRRGLTRALGQVELWVGCVVALLCSISWTPNALAYPSYDDGAGVGCVECHNGFASGSGPLHFQHKTQLGVTSCNLCHPSGGGTTPVLTYWSGSGGGFGCAGCHGQDYGETSPNSGQAKATAYGLRQLHVSNGVAKCGTSDCHVPGALGHPNPFPVLFGEQVVPLYYDPLFSDLRGPCSSEDEDLPFDADSVGLDNDGDGAADWPDDTDCPEPTPSPIPTSTPVPFACGATPAVGCVAAGKGTLVIDEKRVGKEKLRVVLAKLQGAVAPSQLGDPLTGSTAYKLCIYDAASQLRGEYTVARAGETCGTKPCFSTAPNKGPKYRDKALLADGVSMMNLFGGDPGKGLIVAVAGNKASTMPTGVAATLLNQSSATVQLLTSDASCFGLTFTDVKKADGALFKALGP